MNLLAPRFWLIALALCVGSAHAFEPILKDTAPRANDPAYPYGVRPAAKAQNGSQEFDDWWNRQSLVHGIIALIVSIVFFVMRALFGRVMTQSQLSFWSGCVGVLIFIIFFIYLVLSVIGEVFGHAADFLSHLH
jgi:Ca2+/Na+ antiporter